MLLQSLFLGCNAFNVLVPLRELMSYCRVVRVSTYSYHEITDWSLGHVTECFMHLAKLFIASKTPPKQNSLQNLAADNGIGLPHVIIFFPNR